MRQARAGVLALALAIVGVAGCESTGPRAGLRAQVEARRAAWATIEPAHYTYVLERQCFCPPEALGPVRIEVLDGSVVSRTYTESDTPVAAAEASLFPSVDGLYVLLLEAVDGDAFDIELRWDPTTDLPIDVFIDYEEAAVDEELGFEIVELPTPVEAS